MRKNNACHWAQKCVKNVNINGRPVGTKVVLVHHLAMNRTFSTVEMYGTIAERAMESFIFFSLWMKINGTWRLTYCNTHNSHAMEIFLYAVSVTVKSKTFYSLLE
jgi:hypothetical protein